MSRAYYWNHREKHLFLKDSYNGGQAYKEPTSLRYGSQTLYQSVLNAETQTIQDITTGKVRSYLTPFRGETELEFNARHALSVTPPNICKTIVDAYTDTITSQVKRNHKALAPYINNIYRGKTWDHFIDVVAKYTAIHGYVFVVVDTNNTANKPLSVKEALDNKVGPRFAIVEPYQIAWIDTDDFDGSITSFAYVEHNTYETELAPYKQQMTLRVYNRDSFEVRKGAVDGFANIYSQMESLPIVSAGTLPANFGGRVPVLCSYFTQNENASAPSGFSLIDDAALTGLQIYNILSYISDTYAKVPSMFLAIPRPEGEGLDNKARVEIGVSKAIATPAGNPPQWVTPNMAMTIEMRTHCMFLYNSALKVLGLEVTAFDNQSDATSGVALRARSNTFEDRARRFAENLKDFEQELAELVCTMLGVENDSVFNYPTRFIRADITEDVNNAVNLLGAGFDFGNKAKVSLAGKALMAVLGIDANELQPMTEEIESMLAEDKQQPVIAPGMPLESIPGIQPNAGADPEGEGATGAITAPCDCSCPDCTGTDCTGCTCPGCSYCSDGSNIK